MRIRHYGFLASSVRGKSLALCRSLLDVPEEEDEEAAARETRQELLLRLTGVDVSLCPCCKVGRMVRRPGFPALAGSLGRASP